MASDDDEDEQQLAEIEAKLAEIEREGRREMMIYQSNMMVVTVLGLPLAIGAVFGLFVALTRGLGDLQEVALGTGASFAAGLVVAVVFWLGMRAWARWII